MKFSQYICRCGSQDLEVLGSSVNEEVDPALGEITFICVECGQIFVVHMEAIVEA